MIKKDFRSIIRYSLLILLVVSCSDKKVIKNSNLKKKIKPPSLSPFTLGPGDEININVWRNKDLNKNIQIDPSGYIYIPLGGEIKASGLTIPQLRDKIATKLSTYIINPRVNLTLTSIKSQKIHIFGEVNLPGSYTLDTNMFVWEGISKANGFTQDANKKKVLMVRKTKDVNTVSVLNIQEMLTKGKLSQEAYLKNGDIIYVAPTFIANVERFMNRFHNIINPFIAIERGIILYPEMVDVLQGKSRQGGVVIPP